ncbi:polysaccharide deacetylase family protein [Halovulum sp. GXIMD14794]
MSRRLAVLGLHKIGEPSDPVWETWNYVPTTEFTRMLDVIERSGWDVIDLDLLRRSFANPSLIPERALLITFDDGYLSTLTEALPALRDKGYPAVVFVPTAYVGGTNSFDFNVEPTEAMCGWSELAELNANGVAVQGHTVTHPQLSEIGDADLAYELKASRQVLEDRLGTPVDSLAYPYGNADNPSLTADFLSEVGYTTAFLYGGGINDLPIADQYRIARLPVGRGTDIEELLREDSDVGR